MLLPEPFASVCQCAPPEDDEDDREWQVRNAPHCEERVLVNEQGIDLAVFTWPPLSAPCRGVVVLFHGIDMNTRYEFLRHRAAPAPPRGCPAPRARVETQARS